MKKNFMRMIAAVTAVMTVSANAFVCSAEDADPNNDELAVYDENAYADNKDLQEIFDMYKNFEGGTNEDGAPLVAATSPEDIDGGDPSTWGPDEEEFIEISPMPIPDMPNLVSVRTAALIARKAAEGSLSELSASYDANGDGNVNIRDAAFIANQIATKQ